MMEKVIELLQEKPLFVPRILLKHYKEFTLTDQEFLLLIYLLNEENTTFNPKKISEEIGYPLNEVLELMNSITSKDCLSFSIIKNGTTREEHLNFEPLYKKLAFLIVSGEQKKEVSTNLFDKFEQEFGRTLSSMEYEIISGWLDGEFSEELVLLALKEAVYNGVSNLRYIDKILYEWKKKGFKTKEDVERDKENFQNRKKETTKLFDYDWLNE